MNLRQCYRILDLEPGASLKEVRQAYKDIIQVWHPDRFEFNPRLKEKAGTKLKEINLAYETLEAHFNSGQEYDSGGADKGHQAKTEALFEVGTEVFLTLAHTLYASIRQFVSDPQPNAENKEEKKP